MKSGSFGTTGLISSIRNQTVQIFKQMSRTDLSGQAVEQIGVDERAGQTAGATEIGKQTKPPKEPKLPKASRSTIAPYRQYAALPYRITDEVEVLLISSRQTRRWILPKGWPMKGRKPHAAAAQEALEEAGVTGKMGKEPVGVYHYTKRMKNGSQQRCHVTVFPMLVERQRKVWPEMDQRVTRWFPLAEAADLVGEPELQHVIRNFEASPEGQAAEAAAPAN